MLFNYHKTCIERRGRMLFIAHFSFHKENYLFPGAAGARLTPRKRARLAAV
jgi:hypothetical protein